MNSHDSEPQKKLTPDEWDVLNAVEQFYFIDGKVPAVTKLATVTGLPSHKIEKILRDDVVVDALTYRGINLAHSNELLSMEQLAAAAVFFDTKDGRSLKKKLNDIGVTTQQWDAWKRDPKFETFLRARAEQQLHSNLAETEVALMDSAHRGNMAAIQLHLEMAGRWSSKTVGELNIEFLLMKILEAVQKHVKDPEAIEAIAGELLTLAPRSNQPQIPGAVENDRILQL